MIRAPFPRIAAHTVFYTHRLNPFATTDSRTSPGHYAHLASMHRHKGKFFLKNETDWRCNVCLEPVEGLAKPSLSSCGVSLGALPECWRPRGFRGGHQEVRGGGGAAIGKDKLSGLANVFLAHVVLKRT